MGSSDRWQSLPNHSCKQHATSWREIKWKAIYHYGDTCHFVSFIFQNNGFLNTVWHSFHFDNFRCKNILRSKPWMRLIMFWEDGNKGIFGFLYLLFPLEGNYLKSTKYIIFINTFKQINKSRNAQWKYFSEGPNCVLRKSCNWKACWQAVRTSHL